MTTDELDTLPAHTRLYLPSEWEVSIWEFAGRVPGRNYYTLLHPPDQDGVVVNRRPVYIDAIQLTVATLDEQSAWLAIIDGLEERINWIYRMKFTDKVHEKI